MVARAFGGSLPGFVAAFLNQKGISPQEADQIQAMIDQYREGQK